MDQTPQPTSSAAATTTQTSVSPAQATSLTTAAAPPATVAVCGAPVPATTVTPVPVTVTASRTNLLLLGVLVLLAALLLMQVGPRLWTFGRQVGVLPGPVIYALRDTLPTMPCWLLTPEQIRNRSVDVGVGVVWLDDIRASLLQHMRTRNMSSACAQHLEQHNMCYCLVRTDPESETLDDIREMFNLHRADHTVNRWDIVTEKLPFCLKHVKTPRARSITARYTDRNGHIREYDTHGFASYIIQSAIQVQEAKTICTDTNDQVMMAQILVNSYERVAGGVVPPVRALPNNNNNKPLVIGS